jgi:hypothetical protein
MADDFLDTLENVIRARKGGDPETSYVAKLFTRGRAKIAQKLGEEAVETVIAAIRGRPRRDHGRGGGPDLPPARAARKPPTCRCRRRPRRTAPARGRIRD